MVCYEEMSTHLIWTTRVEIKNSQMIYDLIGITWCDVTSLVVRENINSLKVRRGLGGTPGLVSDYTCQVT